MMQDATVGTRRVSIYYGTAPEARDEANDASCLYAIRVSSFVRNVKTVAQLPSDASWIHEAKVNSSNNSNDVVLFVISCSADGSVHRNVRKLMRYLKDHTEMESRNVYVALLGHARCDNSAKQMSQTIYSTGRKFAKLVNAVSVHETQVELEGPDVTFDGWIRSTFNADNS